jgi:hypothetical protein
MAEGYRWRPRRAEPLGIAKKTKFLRGKSLHLLAGLTKLRQIGRIALFAVQPLLRV